jgi:hypothetical protein
MNPGRRNGKGSIAIFHSLTECTYLSLDRSPISFELDSSSIESYDLDLRGLPMTPISIQNALQNHYLGAEDRYIPKMEDHKDETTVQSTNSSLQQSEDRTTIQETYSSLQHLEDRTTVQYADAAIYSPAERTTVQSLAPMSDYFEDRTTCQNNRSHNSQAALPPVEFKKSDRGQTVQHSIVREKEFFPTRFAHFKEQFLAVIQKIADFKQRRSNLTRQLAAAGDPKTQPFSNPINGPTRNGMYPEVQPSSEQYQKVLQELDHCRIAYAKELARNGKIRDAIAQANKIHETSRFFRDAQTLLRSWKQI